MKAKTTTNLNGKHYCSRGTFAFIKVAHRRRAIQLMAKTIAAMALLSCQLRGAIIGVSIPAGSQNPLCRPSYDNISTVTAPPFPFSSNSGIGIIVQPAYTAWDNNQDFALHQNDNIQPSPLYVAPNVPNPATVTVTYLFDRPTIVTGVEIIQHVNGITQVEGLLGNATNALVSLGAVFGPSGDITDGHLPVADGTSQVFDFGNSHIAGTVFQLIVRKTSHPSAFATHRIYPLITIAVNSKNTLAQYERPVSTNLSKQVYRAEMANPDSAKFSHFVAIISPNLVNHGGVLLTVQGTPGVTNIIQASSNLTTWTSLATLFNSNGTFQYTDLTATNACERFYRILIR